MEMVRVISLIGSSFLSDTGSLGYTSHIGGIIERSGKALVSNIGPIAPIYLPPQWLHSR